MDATRKSLVMWLIQDLSKSKRRCLSMNQFIGIPRLNACYFNLSSLKVMLTNLLSIILLASVGGFFK